MPGRQTVNGGRGVMMVMMMRRRRTVTYRTHSATGTHDATHNSRVMRMVWMMSRWEHWETFVKRKHFFVFLFLM
jgi:hypothetical protein